MTAEQAPAPAVPSRGRRGRAVLAGALLVAIVVPALWWASATDPLGPGSGGYGVVSDVAPVASVRPPIGDTSYVATYVEGERVTLQFPLTNPGRVPVRVTDVFPDRERPICGWAIDRVQTSVSTAADYRPFQPFWLAPDEIVDLSVSGRFGCQGQEGAVQGLGYVEAAPVQWSAAGVVPRTSLVPMGYGFGWSEEPEHFLTDVVDRDASITTP